MKKMTLEEIKEMARKLILSMERPGQDPNKDESCADCFPPQLYVYEKYLGCYSLPGEDIPFKRPHMCRTPNAPLINSPYTSAEPNYPAPVDHINTGDSIKISNIYEALNVLTVGVLTFALSEHYEINLTNIIGIIPSSTTFILFDEIGFNKISKKNKDEIRFVRNADDRSIVISLPKYLLEKLHGKKIFNKFPQLQSILDEKNYVDLESYLGNPEIVNRCKRMLENWHEWCDAGLPHVISSLQALQRQLATKMKIPSLLNIGSDIENGLSIEYQCEIFADHLYGAKLLEGWHHFLMSRKSNNIQLSNFLPWLKSLSGEDLKKVDISNLEEIPVVDYIDEDEKRLPWVLDFDKGNVVRNVQLPTPTCQGQKIEIIYALGQSNSSLYFLGGIKKRGTINHSTFFAGKKVEGAGRMMLEAKENNDKTLDWVIECIDDNSGHIKPDDEMALNVLERLNQLGLNLKTIKWVSKWSTSGASDEFADVALKRFKNNCNEFHIQKDNIVIKSNFCIKLKEYAEKGMVGAIDNLIKLQGYKVTMNETTTVAVLILNGLRNHFNYFSGSYPCPKFARSLANTGIRFLRNSGIKSAELETEFNSILTKYEDNFSKLKTATQKTGTLRKKINLRIGNFIVDKGPSIGIKV